MSGVDKPFLLSVSAEIVLLENSEAIGNHSSRCRDSLRLRICTVVKRHIIVGEESQEAV